MTTSAAPATRRVPSPSIGWTGMIVRVLFGGIWGVDAYPKWLPRYRNSYLSVVGEMRRRSA